MHWAYLVIAIVLEVSGTVCMKLSNGLTRLAPTVMMFVFYVLCFGVMSLSLKKIPVSVAYAVWSGIGTLLIALIGIIVFDESANIGKLISIALIIAGVVGVNLFMNH